MRPHIESTGAEPECWAYRERCRDVLNSIEHMGRKHEEARGAREMNWSSPPLARAEGNEDSGSENEQPEPGVNYKARAIVRTVLGCFLVFAGTSHLTFARDEFVAQVPEFVPLDVDATVVLSGVAEIGLGTLLVVAGKRRGLVGLIVALFFIAVFPGNISQWLHQRDAFGLDTDTKRFMRLFFQPVLVWLAWWSTGPRK